MFQIDFPKKKKMFFVNPRKIFNVVLFPRKIYNVILISKIYSPGDCKLLWQISPNKSYCWGIGLPKLPKFNQRKLVLNKCILY